MLRWLLRGHRSKHSKEWIGECTIELCTSHCEELLIHGNCIHVQSIPSSVLLKAAKIEKLQAAFDRGHLALKGCTAELQLSIFFLIRVLCNIANAPAAQERSAG